MTSVSIVVPSANKRDIRSIEQTMADIQAKKRLKREEEEHAQKDVDGDDE